ncbi:hypothetical protein MPC4_50190 [Methylocella tundrae]|uniref:DUF6538 domain-containing protein n=1 Tax=Methylocella tundrae TaxID=227605 RepID=A0A8B6MAH4_METTU|nr:hypothetical protein MPC1_13070002 [Methylocella tundrae]VTZ51882.1 hypothetical protein MPC4_50190 [Methylocella tundrae]
MKISRFRPFWCYKVGAKIAGKVKHLINRQGNFYARIVVPISLRSIVGKTEFRAALG